MAKARHARHQAEHELKGATQRAEQSEKEDEKLNQAVEEAKKKLDVAGRQLETAKKAVGEPPAPIYAGLSGSYGSSSGRRLSLARWMAEPKNPLTARVAVNHIWLRHFGRALVPTVFDFGLSGARPSHPELLNWLASELRQPSLVLSSNAGQPHWIEGTPTAGPWSMKHLHRLIVTARTYRSESTPVEADMKIDPDNQWLWRMPQQRMDAETPAVSRPPATRSRKLDSLTLQSS